MFRRSCRSAEKNHQRGKARIDKALSNEEVRTIITALERGSPRVFSEARLPQDRCPRWVGERAHIRTLLPLPFYRYMRPLIEEGFMYIAQPPLYKIIRGKRLHCI